MRMILARTLIAAGLVGVPSAWAGIFAGNTRPVPVLPNSSSDALPSTMTNGPANSNLQDILNYIYRCDRCVDANDDQSAASMWAPSSIPAILSPVLAFEFSGNPRNIEFGIWSGNDASSLTTAAIFSGWAPASVGSPIGIPTFANLVWDDTGQNLTIISGWVSTPIATYNIPSTAFGFYIRTGSNTWFTDDELNGPSASPQALMYLGGNGASSAGAWTLAFEETAFAESDRDFNDFVVRIESMAAVPEPATILLFGTALLVFASFARIRTAR